MKIKRLLLVVTLIVSPFILSSCSGSDEVENSTYGANLLKTYRFKSIYNDLEPFLLEKTNNSPDNLTKYLVEWKGNKYSIVKVTPLYIDIQWR